VKLEPKTLPRKLSPSWLTAASPAEPGIRPELMQMWQRIETRGENSQRVGLLGNSVGRKALFGNHRMLESSLALNML
jgi:hypothetical protein